MDLATLKSAENIIPEPRVKLTKKALNKFVTWSTSRYNNYCDYGTKKENVERIFASLKAGHYVDWRGKADEDRKVFTVECAGSVGENGNGRYWKTKSAGDDYIVDCVEKTVTAKYRKRTIKFL